LDPRAALVERSDHSANARGIGAPIARRSVRRASLGLRLSTRRLAVGSLDEPLEARFDPIEPRRDLERVVRGDVRVIMGELVLAREVERAIRPELVEAREAPIGKERTTKIRDRARHRLEPFAIAGLIEEVEESLEDALRLAARDRRRLEPARPRRLHIEIVLLRPRRLRVGHLREQEELAAAE